MTLHTEKATYDPDLPHEFMAGEQSSCALCDRPRREDLHQVPLPRERAREGSGEGADSMLDRELGS